MFRPDEYGVVAHHQISFQWFNFSADLVYRKTYPVDDNSNPMWDDGGSDL
jgi:hypothetical protein